MDNLVRQFFVAIDQFLYEQREGRPVGMYSHQERVLPATRTQPAWGNVELAWDETEHTLQPLVELIAKFVQAVTELGESLAEEDDELFSSISNIYRRFSELQRKPERPGIPAEYRSHLLGREWGERYAAIPACCSAAYRPHDAALPVA